MTPSGSRLVARMLERRAVGEQALGEARHDSGDVLAAVEHDERRLGVTVTAFGEMGGDRGERVGPLRRLDAEPLGHRGRDGVRIGYLGEVGPGDVRVLGRQIGRCGERQPRLADAAGPGEG